MEQKSCPATNKKRACAKLLLVSGCVLAALALLIYILGGPAVGELKNNFSVWTIVTLVIVINLVSFLCFIVLYTAWKWIRQDLETGKSRDELDDIS